MSELAIGRDVGRTDWSWLFLVICLVLIVITGLNFHLPQFDNSMLSLEDRVGGWRLLEPLNLARENNVAAWWSGICLLTAGMLAFQQMDGRGVLKTGPSLVLAALLVGLSCDEIGSIHERIGSFRRLAPIAGVALILLIYFLARSWAHQPSRRTSLLILGGFVIFSSVAMQEYLEHNVRWPNWAVGLRFAIEEGTELLGMYVILRALVVGEHGTARMAWGDILPRPSRFVGLRVVLAAGLALHLIAAVMVLPRFDDLLTRGNTATWYPCMVYLLLAFWYRERMRAAATPRISEWFYFYCLVFCSMDAVAAFSQYLPKVAVGIERIVPPYLLMSTGSGRYVLHLALLFGASLSLKLPVSIKVGIAVLFGLAVGGCYVDSLEAQLAIPGLLTFGLITLFLVAFSAERSA